MIKYALLTKKYFKNTVDCVVQTFLYDETMTKNIQISEAEFRRFANLICKKMVLEKMSFICIEKSRVVGFCLNEDLVAETPGRFDKITEKMNPILNLLKKLDDLYMRGKKSEKNIYFHMFMAGSLRKYRRKGIVRNLIQRSLKLAKLKKYKKAVAEATSKGSQRLLIKYFKFKKIHSIDYKKYEFKNKKVFKNINEKACMLLELTLD